MDHPNRKRVNEMDATEKANYRRELMNRITTLHAELHQAGFYSTGQKMHEVVREAGYEYARILDGEVQESAQPSKEQ